MRAVALTCVLGACSSSGGDPRVLVTASYTIGPLEGTGPSVLDPLAGQLVSLELELSEFEVFHAESFGCRSTTFGQTEPRRVAGGPQAALVKSEILDRIGRWDLTFELCDAGSVRLLIGGSIDALNTTHGCLEVPSSARKRDGNMDPLLSTFVATSCNTTILDVVTNRVLTATGFTVSIDTNRNDLP